MGALGLFCRHKWVEERREFIPGVQVQRAKWATIAEVQRLIAGQTIITYLCTVCGRRSQDDLQGRVPKFAARKESA